MLGELQYHVVGKFIFLLKDANPCSEVKSAKFGGAGGEVGLFKIKASLLPAPMTIRCFQSIFFYFESNSESVFLPCARWLYTLMRWEKGVAAVPVPAELKLLGGRLLGALGEALIIAKAL